MSRKQKGELQTITAKNVGTFSAVMGDSDIQKCSICVEEYTILDPENPRFNPVSSRGGRRKVISNLPNAWTEDEILAHKISHVKSPKARRIIGGFVRLTKDEQAEVTTFIYD